ncbi:unnamed protein product, partial [Allacma fusca]
RLTRSNFYRFIQTKKWVVIGVIDEDKLGRSPDHHLEFRDVLEADEIQFGGHVEWEPSFDQSALWPGASTGDNIFVPVAILQ